MPGALAKFLNPEISYEPCLEPLLSMYQLRPGPRQYRAAVPGFASKGYEYYSPRFLA
jgi:hypothetical protein